MPKKRTLSSSDEDVYHVEVITSARVNDNAEWEYLVSWVGYSSGDDSWEPAENVEQCDRLLRNFWRHVGMDNEDYSPGEQFDAEASWIKREREYSTNEWDDKVKKKKKLARDKHYAITISGAGSSGSKKGKKHPNKSLQAFVQRQNEAQSDSSSDDSDEVPLSRSLASKSKGKALPTQRRKGIQPQDDSDSDDREISQKGKRPSGAPSTSTANMGIRSTLANKRRRLTSPGDETGASPSSPPRKHPKTSQPTIVNTPATPTRRDTRHTRGSPSSLFSAPSSPAPILPSQPVAPNPPVFSMLAPSRTNTTEPAKKLPPKPTGPQQKAVRKPNRYFEPKIKRFDDPNLKPSSTLPTKASLGIARTLDTSQASTFGRRGSIQTPTEASTPHSPSALSPREGFAVPQHQGGVIQSPDAQTPAVQDRPRLPPASMAEAEAFLGPLMPHEFSEPMIDGVESIRPSAPVRRQSTANLLKNLSIPRKYKWSGELRIKTEKDHKERLCNVTLSETSEEKLFSLGELQSLRPALTPVAEIAKLGPDTQADEKPLTTLFMHMSSRKLVSCSGINLDDNQVALLLVFPATFLVLCKEFDVRPELRKAGQFIAALLPWKVVGIKARANRLLRDPDDRTHDIYRPGKKESIVMAGQERSLSLRKNPSYHRELYILRVPKWLYDEMPKSPYCVWNKGGDGTPSEPGFETRALSRILDKRRATNVGYKADVSFVFVHVGAIKTLNLLPALMERRMKRLDMQFVTYGTHHAIPPARWGMGLIYPVGGIVSISPNVFVECPSAVYRLLDMLEQHPLWDCFVTPGVVALAARQSGGSDPITEFERGTLIHQDLLSRIGQGQLSLMSVEPPRYGSEEGPLLEWMRGHEEMTMLEPRGTLAHCLRAFNDQFSDFPEEKWNFQVLTQLSSMLSSLQMQPCMMDQYRRFVVITGKQDKIALDWGGFEWSNIDSFNFRDDFFPKEKLEDLRSWARVEQALFALQSPVAT